MSDDRPEYKRNPPADDISESDQINRMDRALRVHKQWIWSDGLRIIKLSSRVERLEKEMAETKSILERILKQTLN